MARRPRIQRIEPASDVIAPPEEVITDLDTLPAPDMPRQEIPQSFQETDQPPIEQANITSSEEAAALRARALRAGQRRSANERIARLAYPKRPGWHQCWMNDVPGNIANALDLGYSFREDEITRERVQRIVGVQKEGGGLNAYLMEIPLEIYKEDQKALEAEMDRIDGQIHRGEIDGSQKDTGLYVPEDDGKPRQEFRSSR